MPKRLKRFPGRGEFHFITSSCYHCRQFLKSARRRRDLFLRILEDVRKLRYIHRNPVKGKLVSRPEEWAWSSDRFYTEDVQGLVTVTAYPPFAPQIRLREERRTHSNARLR